MRKQVLPTCISIILVSCLLVASVLFAQDALLINYQGRLTDDAGNPVSSSGVQLTFTIYSGTETALWTSGPQMVSVNDGLFNYILGSVNPIPDTVFNYTDLYLGIQVGTEPELTPRTKLTSTPYSAVAMKLSGGDVETGDGYLSIHAAEPLLAERVRLGGSVMDTGYVRLFGGGQGTEYPLIELTSQTEEGGKLNIYNEIGKVMGFELSPFNTGKMEFLDPSSTMPNDPCIRMGIEPSPTYPGGVLSFLDPVHGTQMEMMGNSTDGGSIKMFQPQPEPPGREALAMSVNPTSGTSIKMFQPQPEPPGEPLMEFIGDQYGSQMNMYGAASSASDMGINLNAGATEVGIIIVDSRDDDTDGSISLNSGLTETGIIIIDSRTDGTDGSISLNSGPTETGIIIVDSKTDGTDGSISLNSGLTETGIIIIDSKTVGTDGSISLNSGPTETGIIIVDSKTDGTDGSISLNSGLTETGIIIIDSRPGGSSGVVDIFADATDAAVIIQNESPARASNPSIALRSKADSSKMVVTGQTPAMGGKPPVIAMLTDDVDAKVGIGTENPMYNLDVRGTIGNNTTLYHSDKRWKRDIQNLNGSLDRVLKLQGVKYRWEQDEFPEMNFPDGEQIGLIAQDVETVIPEVVSESTDGYKSIDYAKLVSVLIESVKQQQEQIETLSRRVDELEGMKVSSR